MEAQLTQYLRDTLPLSHTLGVTVARVDAHAIELHAPFEPNRNDKGTAFGGSLTVLGTLGGWALIHSGMQREALQNLLVIQHSECSFTKPIVGTLVAKAVVDPESWATFCAQFKMKGKAKLKVVTELYAHGQAEPGARYTGTYVALRPPQ